MTGWAEIQPPLGCQAMSTKKGHLFLTNLPRGVPLLIHTYEPRGLVSRELSVYQTPLDGSEDICKVPDPMRTALPASVARHPPL